MKVWTRIIMVNLTGLMVLVFVYPNAMVSPGPLQPAHAELGSNAPGNCFACHAPFRGAASERCVACHVVADIGIRTTKGLPVRRPTNPVFSLLGTSTAIQPSFHQQLTKQTCVSCHSEHGRLLIRRRFSHSLLRPAVREDCATCHAPPSDAFHRQSTRTCSQCHTSKRWKPSSFDHDPYFSLDGHHKTTCATCHTNKDFSRYTCYGCHEHTPENIRAEHHEEGIRKLDNCVSCHRSGERGEGHEGKGHDDDD